MCLCATCAQCPFLLVHMASPGARYVPNQASCCCLHEPLQDIPQGLGPTGYNFEEEIWHYKHRMLLRLARLGVNVMYLDIDTM